MFTFELKNPGRVHGSPDNISDHGIFLRSKKKKKDVFLTIVASLCFCRLQFRGTNEDYGIQVSDDMNLKHSVDHLIFRYLGKC